MLIDSAESNRPNPDTARNVVKSLLHWFTVINAAVNRYFLQRSRSASNEKRAENASAEAGAVAGGIENTDAYRQQRNLALFRLPSTRISAQTPTSIVSPILYLTSRKSNVDVAW
jgi:hypothetical protein